MKAVDLKVGGFYNWKGQPERLVFMGRKLYPDGFWYQFAKVEEPDVCWSEVRISDLEHFEETLDPKSAKVLIADGPAPLPRNFRTIREVVKPAKVRVLSEREAWNAEVERKKAEKKARKQERAA